MKKYASTRGISSFNDPSRPARRIVIRQCGRLASLGGAYYHAHMDRDKDLVIGRSDALGGTVKAPANKSHSFRALIMAALAQGRSRIVRPAVSNDWMRGVETLEMFGATITPRAGNVWEIVGTGGRLRTPDDIVNCGNSGITLRFFAALAACCEGYTVFTGDHSLRHLRLCGALIEALNDLGAWAVCTKGDGHAPLVVRGMLKGGRIEMDGMDSQPVSALLIALSVADGSAEIIVRNAGEKPWVGLTLSWLDRCGVKYENDNFERYRTFGPQRWSGFDVQIPLDWSAALYPIVAAVITRDSEVRVEGMDIEDAQGDKAVIDVLRRMGAEIEVTSDMVIARSSKLTGCRIDCNDFIDQFMLMAVVGACAEGETVLTNAESCRHKECDRIAEMHKALSRMGADVEERRDGLVVRKSMLRGAAIDSNSDHRMVMTMAVAALAAKGQSRISNVECIKKTFPDFIKQMRTIGCDMQTT
ncbi:MAG: 3-phosphoshikimate 1-carboxyvinyltransferase [Planctomycetes bacterium]|nr:3-phosphoshikimate 1-carboxyvinyltransferase [Planctomycetota bacterium]